MRNKKRPWPSVAAAEYERLILLADQIKKIIEVSQMTDELLTNSIVKRLDKIETQLGRVEFSKQFDLENHPTRRWPRWVVYLLADAPPILDKLRHNITEADQRAKLLSANNNPWLDRALIQAGKLISLIQAGPGPEAGGDDEDTVTLDSEGRFVFVERD